MTSHVTVTAKCGPARQATAILFLNVTEYLVDLFRELLTFKSDGLHHEFDLHGVTTFTDTITTGDHAVVIS